MIEVRNLTKNNGNASSEICLWRHGYRSMYSKIGERRRHIYEPSMTVLRSKGFQTA
jgi:hypothetical protein